MDEILNDYAVKVKVILIGNSTVGKTAFLYRYVDDHFITAFVPTLGIDFKVKTTKFKDRRVKVQAWDSAGQERFRTITTTYYRNAMGFILMYDITNEESFLAVRDWMTEVQNHGKENAQVTLVGNKCDLTSKRVVSYARGKQLADELEIDFFETSAKMNINVVDVFQRLICKIFTVAGEEAIHVPLTLGDLRKKNSTNGHLSNGFNAGPHEKDVCAC